MSANSYRYRLTFQFSKKGLLNLPIDGDQEVYKVLIPGTDGSQPISFASFGAVIKQADIFQLSQGGFPTAEEAWEKAKENAISLTFVAADLGVGVDFGKVDVGDYQQEKGEPSHFAFSDNLFGDLDTQRTQMVGQKLGITVVMQPQADYDFISVRAHADLEDISLTPEGFVKTWLKSSEHGIKKVSEKESLGLELYHNSFFEKSLRTQVLTLIQLLELFAPKIERPKTIRSTLKKLVEDVKAERLRVKKNEALVLSYAGIITTLSNLKYESISYAISNFAEEQCSGCRFGELTPTEFVRKCYGVRSSITHSGSANIAEPELTAVVGGLRQLCLIVLRNRIGFLPLEIEQEWLAPSNLVGGIQFEGEKFLHIHDLVSASEIYSGLSGSEPEK